jgi:hypothetical protein
LQKTVGADGKTRPKAKKSVKKIDPHTIEKDRLECAELYLLATAGQAGDCADDFFRAHQLNPQALTERVSEEVRRAVRAWTMLADKLGVQE